MEDKDIVAKILQGDADSFELLVDKYYDAILRYCARLLSFHHHDAEDATSQAFINCYRHLGGYNPRLKFSSWLYRIAHNESVSIIRKKSKYYTVDPTTIEISDSTEPAQYVVEDLERILIQLKEPERNILTLFYLQEQSINEISEILKISVSAVKVRLKRARDKAKSIANITLSE
jgi:RNA polymerase sigma-70 factor (ECF subfamily)